MKLQSYPTIHPDEEALLRSVINEADDSVPRLVMADWYEENDQFERAEFIRIQIELERMKQTDPRRDEWMLREKRLLRENRLPWTEGFDDRWFTRQRHPVLQKVTDIPSGCRFRRGFVEALKLKDLDIFIDHAPDIYQSIPLQSLTFQESPRAFDAYEALFDSPYFSRLREVSFGDISEPASGIYSLFSHPALDALRILRIGFLGPRELRYHGLTGIAWSKTLTSLIELEIRSNLDVRELQLFSFPDYLPQLNRLILPDLWLDEKKVHLLTTSPKFQKLERLELNYRMFANELSSTEEARLRSRLDTIFGDRLLWAMQYGGRRVVIG